VGLIERAAQIELEDWGNAGVVSTLEPLLPMDSIRYEMAFVAIDPQLDVRLELYLLIGGGFVLRAISVADSSTFKRI
jgi:hypothetical protein